MENEAKLKSDKLILDNMAFVTYIVNKYFRNTKSEFEDLVQIGNIGLIKAARSFDESKGFTFATYAFKSIYNTILIQVTRKDIKIIEGVSFDAEIVDGENIYLKDAIEDESIGEYDFINKDIIYQSLSKLPDKYRQVIKMRYFQGYSQREMSEILGTKQPNISRRLTKAISIMQKNYNIN